MGMGMEDKENERCCEAAPAAQERIVAATMAATQCTNKEKQEDELERQLECEEGPCWQDRMVEDRFVAASMSAQESHLPSVSSLGSTAPSQAFTEEDQVPEKMEDDQVPQKMEESAGAGGKAQKKMPLLLRPFRALGRAFVRCFKTEASE
jgi:hypothetical protein